MDYMQDSLKKQLLTVQDFIAAHPGEAFHLMLSLIHISEPTRPY